MNQLITRIFAVIRKSLDGNSNEVSTARTQSYLVLVPILMMVFVVLGIEISSFIYALHLAKTYIISNEFIIVFGMVLSHHLAILFSRNKSQSIKELKDGGSEENINTQVKKEAPISETNKDEVIDESSEKN